MSMFGRDDDAFLANATRFLTRLWLPEANAEGVLPQDDTFMTKPAIDLSRYKAKAVNKPFCLITLALANEMQILKQADMGCLTTCCRKGLHHNSALPTWLYQSHAPYMTRR
jgi:hypothetical glycosyl hydrolase